ncbi:cytidine deaminase [Alteromonas sediminis]|uniref:Cytidine deaminase n=1 Tax=Alteromonas sediminis TaxID=2259342 RepID=A0A3N5YPZ2_9ALTE|nr:cytidine deaminase [Alteromonas sediminis]RPJ68011.1 cytidine deaminase [Alteromonas sediminis]
MSNSETEHIQALVDAAQAAQKQSYSPYSSFQVGAAIFADDGNTYSGCNIENVAYPLGQCAEATAIGMMIMQGAKRIEDIMIASPNDQVCPPCGGCRQKISEFGTAETKIHMVTRSGEVSTVTLGELLPLAFDSL